MSCFFDDRLVAFVRPVRTAFFVVVIMALTACGMGDDLMPSDSDLRARSAGTYLPGEALDAVTRQALIEDSEGGNTTLEAILADPSDPPQAVVVYFTMWCPICLAHTDHLYTQVLPRYASRPVRFLVVDYVSGSWQDMRAAAAANGYPGAAGLEIVRDAQGILFERLHGAMGNVVVVDSGGVIRMNAYYHDGRGLEMVLDGLVP